MCSVKRSFMGMRPPATPFIRAMRPRGESASDCVRRYVGQWGRQRPQATQRFASALILALIAAFSESGGKSGGRSEGFMILSLENKGYGHKLVRHRNRATISGSIFCCHFSILEAFFTSTALVALAEIGDKTQLLSFVLAAKLRQPYPIMAGILAATLLNHALAATAGGWLASLISPQFPPGLSGCHSLDAGCGRLKLMHWRETLAFSAPAHS